MSTYIENPSFSKSTKRIMWEHQASFKSVSIILLDLFCFKGANENLEILCIIDTTLNHLGIS